MGFEFSNHKVEVEICGSIYVINMGDASMLDTVDRWGEKLRKTDYASLGDGRTKALTVDLRNYLLALLGKGQFDAVFKGRDFNLINGLELFAYLYSEIVKSRVDVSFVQTLNKYMPDVDWLDGE